MNEHELQVLMEEADAVPAPAPRVDAAALVAAGRGAARRRRLVGSAAAAVAVVAVTAGAVGVSRLAAAPPAGHPATGSSDGPAVGGSAARFDPLVQTAALGWAPAGLPTRAAHLSADRQEYLAEPTPHGPPPEFAMAGLVVHAPGWRPDHPTAADCGRGAPDGTVNGQPAYRLTQPGATGAAPPGSPPGTAPPHSWIQCEAGLMWQYAPGRWAEAWVEPGAVRDGPGPAWLAHDQARRIAEQARFGLAQRIRLPFTVSGLPAGYTLTEGYAQIGSAESTAITGSGVLVFADGHGGRTHLACWATSRTDNPKAGRPDTTLDGHPARYYDSQPAQLFVFAVHGCEVAVERHGPATHAQLTALYRTVHPVPQPQDLANWTDRPLG